MEAFSLLKYWGRGGGGGAAAATSQAVVSSGKKNTTTIATTALRAESDDDDSVEGEDEGPFIDLEFAVPEEEESGVSVDNDDGVEEEEEMVEVTEEPGVSLSSTDDLFFNGRLVPLESSTLVFNDSDQNGKNQLLPVSLRKSATKFRVFTMKGLKRPKSAAAVEAPVSTPSLKQHQQSKFFTVKFKVEEVPIVSLFTRDNSSRGSSRGPKQSCDESAAGGKSSKEVVNKYLNKIKPLYVKVSRKSNGDKSKLTDQVGAAPVNVAVSETTAPVEVQKQTHFPNHVKDSLRVVRKHLGKSRSASSAVAAVPLPPTGMVTRRRDAGEQVTSVLQEMITLLEDMEMDEDSEAAAVELAAQGVIGKRVDEMESGFMMALDWMIQLAEKDQDDQRKSLLEVIKQTVLDHLTKKCPPHVQVIGLLCRTPKNDSRHELLRRVAAGGGVFKDKEGTKVQLPAANLNDIANQADDLLETMESRPSVPDRKLLARLVLIREEARGMMGGGILDERNDRGLSTLPEAEVNFLAKLVALKPGKTVRAMIKNVMQGEDEGSDEIHSEVGDGDGHCPSTSGVAGRGSVTGRKPRPVRPGMFLETVSKVLGGVYSGNVSGMTVQHLEWVHQKTLEILQELAF